MLTRTRDLREQKRKKKNLAGVQLGGVRVRITRECRHTTPQFAKLKAVILDGT